MIKLSIGKGLDETTRRLVRTLPVVLRGAFEEAVPALEDAARAGLGSVQPRADGEPALVGMASHMVAEVRTARDGGPKLVLTADGTDDRGIPWARVLNVHANGVRRVSKSELKRRAEEKRRRREERAARQDAHVRARAAQARELRKSQQDAHVRERAANSRQRDAHVKARARAIKAQERAAIRARGLGWRLPPRNPMDASARDFENRLLGIIIARVKAQWR